MTTEYTIIPTAELAKDAARLKGLRELCGYWQDSSDTTVKLFQDDATRTWIIKVDDDCYYGNTFNAAIDAAIAAHKENTNVE